MSRKWVRELLAHGHSASHWLAVGNRAAPDLEIMEYARKTKSIVLTCDLDFGDILAASGGATPSVLQLRPGKLRPEVLITRVIAAITQHNRMLQAGSLITIDLRRSRVRALPLTL